MYLQEIVISPDIFEKISRAYSEEFDLDIDLKSYKENLELKKIIFDKDEREESEIENLIKKIKNNSSDFGKQKIDSVLKIFLKEGKYDYKFICELNKYCKDELSNKLLNLAINTESKIINSEDKKLCLQKINNPELTDLEVLNFEEFINPTSISKVYCHNKTINVKKGEKFYFEEYFRPYLSETKTLTVTDKYLRKRKGGYMNLKRLLKVCKNLESLQLNTILETKPEEYKLYIEIKEIEAEIIKIHNSLKLSFFSTVVHQRSIETDDYKITIDPGLDFVNDVYVAKRHDVELNFKSKY